MARPTSITVSVDDTEYSRYEAGRDTITATVDITGGAPYTDEPILVQLVKARRSRDAVVATTTVEVTGVSDPQSFEVQFYLPNIVDQDEISLIRRGDYFVQGVSEDLLDPDLNVTGDSPDFCLSIITAERLKNDFLWGLDLASTALKDPKFQPTQISGIEITEISKNFPMGFVSLSYVYDDPGTGDADIVRQISLNGGTLISLNQTGTFILKEGAGGNPVLAKLPSGSGVNANYICIKVRSLVALPIVSTFEEVLLERKSMDDDVLKSLINRAADYVEKDYLQTYVEPTNVVSDRDPTTIQFSSGSGVSQPGFTDSDWDFINTPLSYFKAKDSFQWIKVDFPVTQMLRCDALFGAVANVRVVDIDLQWIEISMHGGMAQLVPFNQEIAYDFIGLIWFNTMTGADVIPNFWHYNIIAGIRQPCGDIMELIGKNAAISALGMAGAALFPALGSVSISRDGVSQSTSYVTGMYGKFNGLITNYKDWIKENGPRLIAKYRGIKLTVV